MRIIIKESQLKTLVNEIGGYDTQQLMSQHSGDIQSTLLFLFNELTVIISTLLNGIKSGKLEKEDYLLFADNLSKKIDDDLDIINSYIKEIYIDDDFKSYMIKYRNSLQKFQNRLRLIYDGGIGLGIEMSKNEIYKVFLDEVDKLSLVMEPLSKLFYEIYNRFRTRLGLD